MSDSDPLIAPDDPEQSADEQFERRVIVRGNCDTPISIHWTSDGEAVVTRGMLLDLSRNGIRLMLEEPIPLKKAIHLRIRAIELDFDCTLSAEVCWIRSRGPKQWLLGCSFATDFPEEALVTLAQEGFLNRRKDPRVPISVTAFARQELMPEAINVRLEDYSRGGFRMFTPLSMNVGERALILVRDEGGSPLSIAARVLWQLEVDGGMFVGCGFLNPEGHAQLVQAIRRHLCLSDKEPDRAAGKSPSKWGRRLVSIFSRTRR